MPRRVFPLLLLASCSSVPPETRAAIPGLVGPITPESCRTELEALVALGPRYAGDAGATERTLRHLEARLASFGYRTRREPAGSFGGFTQFNLLAELPGEREPGVVCELGAHYDTVPDSPGADDNGSGVVGVLESARVLAHHRPERTLRFCFFAGEERGLFGSRAHVRRRHERPDERIDGLLDLEMIGFATHEPRSQRAPVRIPFLAWMPYTGNFILVAGNFRSGGLGNVFERCIRRYVPDLRYYSANRIAGLFGDGDRSDHSSYWEANLRGIMITDTANFRNPHYHAGSDTPETLDYGFLSAVARASAATMVEWGGRVPAPSAR